MSLNLNNLNPQQKEAVLATEGPVLIIAGAGTGKTQCLTCRLAYIIEKGVNPENILALTFTNKAAEEMRQRVLALLAQNYADRTRTNAEKSLRESAFSQRQSAFVGTFHSFGAKILRQELRKENSTILRSLDSRTKDFTIFDDDDSLSLIKKIIKNFDLDSRQFSPSIIKDKISGLKAELINPENYAGKVANFFEKIILKIYREYEKELAKNNAFDFDDLIMKPVALLQNNNKILEKYQNQYRYILIDEYQDTNHAQYVLTKLLAAKYRNLCVVGDDQQSIYSWRKADFRNILNFEKDFPEAKVILLEENYRSTKKILEAANAVIANNIYQKKKNLRTKNEKGLPLYEIEARNEKEEARFIARNIKELIENDGLNPSDISVLYRINAQSRAIEELFIKYDISYQIIGGIKFYQRREVKDILAVLRLIYNSQDEISRERIAKIPPFKKNLEEILEKSAKKLEENKLCLAEFIKFVIKQSDYETYLLEKFEDGERRVENMRELESLAQRFNEKETHEALLKFLEAASLYQESDERDSQKQAVNLMTIHSAKGLEFNTVFVAGCEEGLFPHSRSITPEEVEEERRLCYVAITRAKNKIYLSYASRRLIFGSIVQNCRSRFLDEIPEELTEKIDEFSDNYLENEFGDDEEESWIEY